MVYDLLAQNLSQYYQLEKPYRCQAAVLDIVLKLEIPCRRRLIIPINCTFQQFHGALQMLFSWKNHHLHDFWLKTYPNGGPREALVGSPREDVMVGETSRPDTDVVLSDVFPQQQKIIYNYNLVGDWIHEITFVDIMDDYPYNYPQCILAIGDAPPEDIGGVSGYAKFLRIMANPKDEEYNETKRWADRMCWQQLDIESINRRLRISLRHI